LIKGPLNSAFGNFCRSGFSGMVGPEAREWWVKE